jgi:hypothetical protein
MAEDKFKDLFTNRPTFVQGEQPTGRKFTQWAQQTDEAFLELEKAVGNMWGSFWIENDVSPLLFNTLARAVGSLDRINPLIPHDVDVTGYIQSTVAGQNYLWLDLFPNGAAGSFMTSASEPAITPAQYQSSRTDLTTSGDWTVVGRKIYTFDIMTGAGNSVTYNGTTGDGTGGTPEGDLGTYFTVIPHLAQLTGAINTACSVTQKELAGETYYEVILPKYLVDYNGDVPIVGTDVQLKLPPQAVLTPGDEIPHGIIRLWDGGDPVNVQLTQPINDSARYYAVNDTAFHIYNVVLEGLEDEDDEVNTRYFVVTGGSSLAETLGKAWERMFTHTHGPYDFIPGVKHPELDDLEPNGLDVDGSPLGWLLDYSTQSIIANNAHPQYMYREGFQIADPGSYYNMMVGDLVLSSVTEDSGDRYRNILYDSNRVQFGSNSGSYIYWDVGNDRVTFKGHSGGSGWQFGETGDGIEASLTIYNTLDVTGDVTFNADLSVGVEFTLAGYMVNEISNDDTMASNSANALCTEAAIKGYVDTEVAKPLDIPSTEIILFDKDTVVIGYTLLTDHDDLTVLITKGSGAGGETGGTNNGEAWSSPVADHAHRFHKDNKKTWDVNGNEISFSNPDTGKTTTGLIVRVWHADSTAAAGDRYTEPVAVGGDDTWRPPGRHFTRQQRN